jgi:hypothetical protein
MMLFYLGMPSRWLFLLNLGLLVAFSHVQGLLLAADRAGLDFQHRNPDTLLLEYMHEQPEDLGDSNVLRFSISLGAHESSGNDLPAMWVQVRATKVNGELYTVSCLSHAYPSDVLEKARESILRYITQEGSKDAVEYRNLRTGRPVLPSTGAWAWLLPRSAEGTAFTVSHQGRFPTHASLLGHTYTLQTVQGGKPPVPVPSTRLVELLPDLLLGVPHNTKQRNPARRYDTSDYELVPMDRSDFRQMVDAGMTCLRVDAGQIPWVEHAPVFYWGPGGAEVPYPESLYRSNYLGPVLFLDEPAVHTRDHVLRPMLKEDAQARRDITPAIAFDAFRSYFDLTLKGGIPRRLINDLRARGDMRLGEMDFLQANIYSWETMVSSSAYQLTSDPLVPSAIVFEPPGRVGTLRTLPELNMSYGCQLPPDDPKALSDMIYAMLRGAARQIDKRWGMSIYGAVDRSDAFWFQTHAYDLGATHFFFWDTYQLACVPFPEVLTLARNLRNHADQRPNRSLDKLREAAEVAILFPPGYNLGHVALGKGNLWGLGELNLERRNSHGVSYRTVMHGLLVEVERFFKQGVAFDLLWNTGKLELQDYREVVLVREDGRIEVRPSGQAAKLLDGPRMPLRAEGRAPELKVTLARDNSQAIPAKFTVKAIVEEQDAPVYYNMGADVEGIYHNAVVLWELYGPREEDYRYLRPEYLQPNVHRDKETWHVQETFTLEIPGMYRLRTSTVDKAGRTVTDWTVFNVE